MISSYEHCLQCVQDVRSRRTLFFGAVDQAKVHRHRVSMKLCGSHYRRSQIICCARQVLKSLGDHKWEQRFPGFAKRLASAGNTISVPPWCSPTHYTRLHKPLPLFFGSVGSVCSITVPRARGKEGVARARNVCNGSNFLLAWIRTTLCARPKQGFCKILKRQPCHCVHCR